MVRGFFGSGHVDTAKIVHKYRYDDYVVPLHEFLRAITFGDAAHHDPSRSPIANLFDIGTPDLKEHFLTPGLLGFLQSPQDAAGEDGFVLTKALYERFQILGFTPEQIDLALIRSHRKRLIETSARAEIRGGALGPNALRITTVGVYHILTLSHQFTYLDAIIVDTPLLDQDLAHAVGDTEDIRERLKRANKFRSYLDRAWSVTPTLPGVFDWHAVSTDLESTIRRIGESLDRAKAERNRR